MSKDGGCEEAARRRSVICGTQVIKCFVEEEIPQREKTSHRMRPRFKKRLKWSRLLVTAAIIVIGYLCILQAIFFNVIELDPIPPLQGHSSQRKLLQTPGTTVAPDLEVHKMAIYPPEIFSLEQRRQGAVILHVFGMIYMFVALAIVCDEFFVPSLEVIIDKLDISEDVAGATFMAAGGSAPELFTSIIGVFLARSNVGIGTIVGSAVFNILFVIGICAITSKTVLHLTWWPIFRDVTFYSIDLILLIGFFIDSVVYWWESLILLSLYAWYVIFMKFNFRIESWVKSKIRGNQIRNSDKHNTNGVSTNNHRNGVVSASHHRSVRDRKRAGSVTMLRGTSSRLRQGMLQLLIHTIDPIGDAKVDEKGVKLHAIASLNVVIESDPYNGELRTKYVSNDPAATNGISTISNGQVDKTPRNSSTETTFTTVGSVEDVDKAKERSVVVKTTNVDMTTPDETGGQDSKSQSDMLEEEASQPLDLSWPDKWYKRISFVLVSPIILCLWITLPDVRRPEKRKWFPMTFIGSILWIGGFSYLMVWWANQTGETIGINDEVMGLTIIAAGTSIPDLITSVIVARKGFGDMAVSSSVGSNIFDVTVGLPFPWLMFCAVFQQSGKNVNSEGLFCSIILLFLMLIFVIVIIAIFRWRMSKVTGASMLLLYLVFLVLSVLLQLRIIVCPVST